MAEKIRVIRLAPEIQQHILAMRDVVPRPAITERALRPVVQLESAAEQRARFGGLSSGADRHHASANLPEAGFQAGPPAAPVP